MKRLFVLATLTVLAACNQPVATQDSPDFGFGDYFESQHEFAAWVQVGCYQHGRRVAETLCD